VGATQPANTAKFTDSSAQPNTQYSYRVKATNATGSSGYSNEATATTPKAAYTRTEDTFWWLIAYVGDWFDKPVVQASGGGVTYVTTSAEPASAAFTWTGTDVSVYLVKGPQMGMARIWVDDAVVTVDLYASKLQLGEAVFTKENLAKGSHTVTIQQTGQKNARSTGFTIALDAIDTR
jgi:hypothetical protein